MPERKHVLLRASARIREHLVRQSSRILSIQLPDDGLNECLRLVRLLDQVSRRGWPAATAEVEERLAYEMRTLRGGLDVALGQLQHKPSPLIAAQREIFEDLLAMDQEFLDVEVDLKLKQISLTTDPIELEQIYLGPFRIVLNWESIGRSSPYSVEATDPQAAATSSETTHPHVNGDKLCEGEAGEPIRGALRQGRLFDFFVIVRQTLETYNAGSAYVRLGDWQGTACHDCGTMMDEDEQNTCQRCGNDVCSGCAACCQGCECEHCNPCIKQCPGCDGHYCKSCLSPCRSCDAHFCTECLDDDRCNNCQAVEDERRREEEQERIEDETDDRPTDGAAVHSYGLGQATAPA